MAGADKSAADAALTVLSIQEAQFNLSQRAMREGMALGAEAAPGPETGAEVVGGVTP
jgi:hypothetical protein